MKVVNKYHPAWQIVRVKARSIKDPSDKLTYVVDWFNENSTLENYERVHNWIKMTAIAYRDLDKRMFLSCLVELEDEKENYRSAEEDYDFSYYSREDLEMVYKDLLKRKYGFQYKKVPKSHIQFMDNLSRYLKV